MTHMQEAILGGLAVLGAGWILSTALDTALTIHHENQNTMLCKSAIKSGNETYQQKCQCYYKTGDITCVN